VRLVANAKLQSPGATAPDLCFSKPPVSIHFRDRLLGSAIAIGVAPTLQSSKP
jgi:hypothetical protein